MRSPTTKKNAATTMPRWPAMYWKKTRCGKPAFRSGVMMAWSVPASPQKYVSSTSSGTRHQQATAATITAMSHKAKGSDVLAENSRAPPVPRRS